MTDSKKTKTMLDKGVISVTLGGKAYELVVNVKALFDASRLYGGIVPLGSKINAYDGDAIITLLRIGSRDLEALDVEKVRDLVFEAGVMEIGMLLFLYVNMLASPSGKPKSDAKADKKDAAEGNA